MVDFDNIIVYPDILTNHISLNKLENVTTRTMVSIVASKSLAIGIGQIVLTSQKLSW